MRRKVAPDFTSEASSEHVSASAATPTIGGTVTVGPRRDPVSISTRSTSMRAIRAVSSTTSCQREHERQQGTRLPCGRRDSADELPFPRHQLELEIGRLRANGICGVDFPVGISGQYIALKP